VTQVVESAPINMLTLYKECHSSRKEVQRRFTFGRTGAFVQLGWFVRALSLKCASEPILTSVHLKIK